MHQTSCGNGFLILAEEGLEGAGMVCKPPILAECERVSVAVWGQKVASVFMVYPTH